MLTASYEEKIIEIAGIKEKDIPNWQCALDMIGIWRYYRERFYVVMVGSKPWKRARTFGLLPSNEPLITDIIQDIKQQ